MLQGTVVHTLPNPAPWLFAWFWAGFWMERFPEEIFIGLNGKQKCKGRNKPRKWMLTFSLFCYKPLHHLSGRCPGMDGKGSLCCNLRQVFVTPTYRPKGFRPIIFLHMKWTHFLEVSVSGGTEFAVFLLLRLCAVREAQQLFCLLHASTEEGCEAPRHPRDTATPGGHNMWAFLTANEGARDASAHEPPKEFASSP